MYVCDSVNVLAVGMNATEKHRSPTNADYYCLLWMCGAQYTSIYTYIYINACVSLNLSARLIFRHLHESIVSEKRGNIKMKLGISIDVK